MSERGKGQAARGERLILPLAACLLPLALSGCRTVVDTVADVFGPGTVGEAVDAHVVYRLRPGCPALLARTMQNGYTVLSPRAVPLVEGVDPLLGRDIEETGVFEGPVRPGEVVFRYVPPAASDTWDAGPVDVAADVDAVRLDLEAGHGRMVALCGPLPSPADPDVGRLPGRDL